MSDEPYGYRTNDRRVIPWLLFGLVLLFGALYVAGYYVTSDRIPRGTTVSGISVGGLTPAAAATKLRTGLEGRAAEPIDVTANGARGSIMPSAAGLSFDVPATVLAAGGGRSWDPVRMWDYFAGGTDQDAVVRVDRAALDRAVAGFADRVDVPATNGSVVFVGAEADPTYPQKGIVVDRARAARTLADAFLHRGPTVDLATHDALPTVTKDAVSRAMDGFANPAMSGPVVLSLAGSGVQVQPQEFGPALSLRPAGTRLVPRVDAPALLAVLAPKLRTLVRSPTDASFTVVAGRVVVVAGTTGVGYHAGDITSRFLSVVTGSAAGRTLRVPPVAVRPRFTTPAARRLGVTQLVSSFTTTFAADPTRTAELTRLAGLLDGTVLRPRQAFSLDDVVASAPVTGDVDSAVGQLAATTFNTAFFAGLRFVEHRPHPSYVARFPAGREATAVPGGIDLRFVDDTPYGVYVTARVGPSGSLRVAMYSTKRWNIRARQSARTAVLPPATQRLSGPGCVPSQGSAGFDVNVTRLFYRAGTARLDHRETMHTHYVPVDRVVCS